MNPVRTLMLLIRAIGVIALAALFYWWTDPAGFGKWFARERPSPHAVVAAAPTPAAAPASKPVAAPVAAPADAAAPKEVVKAAVFQMPPARASRSQRAIAEWLGAKYRVSPAAVAILVVEADLLAREHRFSPNLLMAIMAIESNFHPYIQSEAGAQGLMQVMPAVHAKRYEKFGGKEAMLDPVVGLKVGAEILHELVKLKGGSENEALRAYFGGGPSSGAYIDKVRGEQQQLNRVATGVRISAR